MKKLCFILALLLSGSSAFSQLNDQGKVWIFGSGGVSFNTTFTTTGPVVSFYDSSTTGPRFTKGNSNICDSSGNLVVASDGYSVYDAGSDTIDGGYKLVPQQVFAIGNGWSSYSQSSIFLPAGNGKYYFITPTASDAEVINNWMVTGEAAFDLLLYNVIDMNANGGAGKVVKKMVPLLEHVKLSKSQMMACKHGDGKSWWLLKMAQDTNIVYKFLFTRDSVLGPYTQSFAAPRFYNDAGGQSVFTKDGTRFATTCRGTKKIFLADFDRCTGDLTNPLVYDVPTEYTHNPFDTSEKEPWTEGLAFSPNGRFLYVSKYYNIQQLDLQDNNPTTAWETVAGLDTTWDWFPQYSSIYLGPDDKLYLGYWSGQGGQMSYFNYPDNKGAASSFCKRCLQYPGFYYQSTYYNYGVTTPPCMPNYKLGPTNPICWPLGVEEAPKRINFKVYPNPAASTLTIEYDEAGSLELIDMLGRVVKTILLPEQAGKTTTGISGLIPGVYSYRYIVNGESQERGKIVVMD